MTARSALALALAGIAVSSSFAFAAEAPKSTATSRTLFLSQEGCGTTETPGRLEPTAQVDTSTGCGTIGGLPFNEIIVQDGGAEAVAEDFTSTAKMKSFKLDSAKKITGQLAAGSWVGNGSGGFGTVTFTVVMTAKTTAGKTINFGTVKVSGAAAPGKDVVEVPFELAVPATAKGATIKTVVINVAQHGANLGMSSKQFDGSSYVVIPAKK